MATATVLARSPHLRAADTASWEPAAGVGTRVGAGDASAADGRGASAPASGTGARGASVSASTLAPAGQAATDLVASAERTIVEASVVATAAERYALAHLAALRAAAAVLAARGRPKSKRGRQVASAWAILPVIAPELAEWAAFFAAGARKRQSAEAGIACVSHREADDLVRESARFLERVCDVIGVVHQPAIEPALRSVS